MWCGFDDAAGWLGAAAADIALAGAAAAPSDGFERPMPEERWRSSAIVCRI